MSVCGARLSSRWMIQASRSCISSSARTSFLGAAATASAASSLVGAAFSARMDLAAHCHSTRSRSYSRTTSRLEPLEVLPYHLVVGLPALSPTMMVGTLAEWYVQEGDSFAAGDGLAKMETDKAAMDFEAQDDGFVAKLLVPAGGPDLAIGTPIMITVETAADVAAFANYSLPPVVAVVEEAKHPVTAAVAPVVTVAPVALVAPSAPVAAPVVFSTAWGGSVVTTSPLAKSLAASQSRYMDLYGTTGQVPIL